MAVGFPTKANWAAGDVLTASAQDDLAGTVNLLSNASAASGSQLVSNVAGTSFAYQATPSASNPVLNSGMNVWQRGTSVANPGNYTTYTADRWCGFRNNSSAGLTVTRQITNDTTNLPFIQYCARVQRDSGNTNTGNLNFTNSFEIINSIPFAGKTITLSYYARSGANFSPSPASLTATIYTGTGSTEVNRATTSYTGDASPLNTTVTLTATWQRFTITGNLASNITQMAVFFASGNCVSTALANDYFEITGVQIDIGSVALPFRTYAATYQGELAACQRYLPAILVGSGNRIYGYAGSTTSTYLNATFPVTARVAPTGITPAGNSNFTLLRYSGTSGAPTSISFDSGGVNSASMNVITTAGSPILVANDAVQLAATSSGAYILFTGCEL